MEKSKFVRNNIIYLIIAVLYVIALGIFNIDCLITYVFKIPCPACGMTRALISLAKLNFKESFKYHPMAVPLLAAIFLGLNYNEKPLHKKWVKYTVIIISILVFLVYIIRLISGTIP